MKKGMFVITVLLVSLLLALTACEDAVDSIGPGVKGTVEDSNGEPIKGAKVKVIGIKTMDDLDALLKAADISSFDKVKDMDEDKEIVIKAIKDNAETIKDDETDGDGKYSVGMTAAAFFVFVEGPDESYKTGMAGLPSDKKFKTLFEDLYAYIEGGLKDDDKKYFIPIGTKKEKRNFTLGGGTNSVDENTEDLDEAAPAQSAAPSPSAEDKFHEDGNKKQAPDDAPDENKEYYSFSFVFAGTMDGDAYGEFDRDSFGDPIAIKDNETYTWSSADNWSSGGTLPARKPKSGGEESSGVDATSVVLTGLIEEFAGKAKYLVYEVSPDGTDFSTHYHFIGFDENGVYETRAIYLPEGWVTRLSMCESIGDDGPVGQSYRVEFDYTNASETAKVISLMSYDKGFAEEKGKSTDYEKVVDLDFAMTNVSKGETIAWYNSDVSGTGRLSFDTWFGYGPEMIIGYGDWSDGFTPYTEPYSIGSEWNPGSANIKVNFSVITANDHKNWTTTFDDNGESFSPGTFDLDMKAVSR